MAERPREIAISPVLTISINPNGRTACSNASILLSVPVISTVIERFGFRVLKNRINGDGLCPDCHKPLPGVWGKASGHGDGRVRPLL